LILVEEFRIECLEQSGEGLALVALRMPLTGTGEDPGVLSSIPEQGCLTVPLLALCACCCGAEGTSKGPFADSTREMNLKMILEIIVKQ
jgi:hypothetical protein